MKNKNSHRFDALTACLAGVAGLFDIWGMTDKSHHLSENPYQDDTEAIASDWRAVGQDLYHAMQQYDACVPTPSTHQTTTSNEASK